MRNENMNLVNTSKIDLYSITMHVEWSDKRREYPENRPIFHNYACGMKRWTSLSWQKARYSFVDICGITISWMHVICFPSFVKTIKWHGAFRRDISPCTRASTPILRHLLNYNWLVKTQLSHSLFSRLVIITAM